MNKGDAVRVIAFCGLKTGGGVVGQLGHVVGKVNQYILVDTPSLRNTVPWYLLPEELELLNAEPEMSTTHFDGGVA